MMKQTKQTQTEGSDIPQPATTDAGEVEAGVAGTESGAGVVTDIGKVDTRTTAIVKKTCPDLRQLLRYCGFSPNNIRSPPQGT